MAAEKPPGGGSPAVLTPTPGVDPRDALATSLFAAPGVYAVLLGSGFSKAAGIPTAWGVVQDLIRKVAVGRGVPRDHIPERPEAWWQSQGLGEPRFDVLLREMTPTVEARRSLLRAYFDPAPGQGGPLGPTPAHHSLAHLCKDGRVRVVVTTNFDRLLERALAAADVEAQVISRPQEVRSMTPLAQAPITVVKLHGDFLNSPLLATPDDLATYRPPWRRLLRRIFDEYGLIVIGWSGEYDIALANVLRESAARRYPMYWAAHHGHLCEGAQALVGFCRASVVPVESANELLTDMDARMARLGTTAARRIAPRWVRNVLCMPQPTVARPGWTENPLLVVRAAVGIELPMDSDLGIISPQERRTLVETMNGSHFLGTLQIATTTLHSVTSAREQRVTSIRGFALPTNWVAAEGGLQSTEHAVYRVGTDGTSGVSAVAEVRMPNRGLTAQGPTLVWFIIDAGLSVEGMVTLDLPAALLRDAVVLASGPMYDAMLSVFPVQARVERIEVHLMASRNVTGASTRPNDLPKRVDLVPLGEKTRDVDIFMGYAVEVDGPLTSRPAGDLVATAFYYMALDHGYLDPTRCIDRLRLGLSVAQPTAPIGSNRPGSLPPR